MASDVASSWSAKLALVGFLGSDFVHSVRTRRNFDPQVVHAHWWFPNGVVGAWLGRLARVPLVTTLHGTDVRLARTVSVAKPMFAHVLRHSAAVTAVSNWLKDEAEALVPGVHPIVAPMPVATDLFAPGSSRDGQRLLFVGRLMPQKGVEHLLHALVLMKSRRSTTCSPATVAAVSSAGQGASTHSLPSRPNRLRAATQGSTDRFLALTRRNLFRVAQWVFAAVVLFFAARSLATQWDKVGSRLTHIQFGWQWIAAATALVFVTYALPIEGWRREPEAWNSHLPFRQASRIWFLSNLGKYVPGNIWSLTAMGEMAKKRGMSAIAAAGSSVIMQMVSLATGTAIVMVTSAKLLGQPLLVGAAVLVLAIVLLSAPKFLPPFAGCGECLIGSDMVPPSGP